MSANIIGRQVRHSLHGQTRIWKKLNNTTKNGRDESPSLSFYPLIRRISSNFSNFNFAFSSIVRLYCVTMVASHFPFVKELQLRSTCKSQILIAAAHLSNFNFQYTCKVRPLNAGFLFCLHSIAAGMSHCREAASRLLREL